LTRKEDSVDDQERDNHVNKEKQQASHEVGLVQLRRDCGKGGVELGANALHGRNNGESYPSGNEAIFNGGRP
jgi:hypothetical protein